MKRNPRENGRLSDHGRGLGTVTEEMVRQRARELAVIKKGINMHECEVCGNEYDKPLEIVVNGISHYFDCFECAIHGVAPECDHCGCKIIGHGVEAGGNYYCCAHCAHEEGVTALHDRA